MTVADIRFTAVEGSVSAPAGFRAAGVACGIKKTNGLDLALIVSDRPASAAAVFTTNKAQAAPVLVSKARLQASGGHARAIAINSGCANACTGSEGLQAAREMAAETARLLSCPVEQVLVASTGVIGVALPIDKVRFIGDPVVCIVARDPLGEAADSVPLTHRGSRGRECGRPSGLGDATVEPAL